MIDDKELEEVWKKKSPTCGVCGWCPCFYEIEDSLERKPKEDNETEKVYWAGCIGENQHNYYKGGYYLYVPKTVLEKVKK